MRRRRYRARVGSRFIVGSPEPVRRPFIPFYGRDDSGGWERIREGVDYDEYAIDGNGAFGRMSPQPRPAA
jgi:hypothetical protein